MESLHPRIDIRQTVQAELTSVVGLEGILFYGDQSILLHRHSRLRAIGKDTLAVIAVGGTHQHRTGGTVLHPEGLAD